MTRCRQENEKKCCIFTVWPCPSTKPLPRGHEIYNFGKPFLGHHYFILSLPHLFPWVEKKILQEIMHEIMQEII